MRLQTHVFLIKHSKQAACNCQHKLLENSDLFSYSIAKALISTRAVMSHSPFLDNHSRKVTGSLQIRQEERRNGGTRESERLVARRTPRPSDKRRDAAAVSHIPRA
jgi:hypothetical protein